MEKPKKFKATQLTGKTRLDKFVNEKLDVSRSQIKKMIEAGQILVNDKQPSVHEFLNEGDVIEVHIKKTKTKKLPKIKILAEESGYVVIEKPAGVLVHSTDNSNEETIVDWLLKNYPEVKKIGEPGRQGIVHRLDRDTSGVLLLTISNKMHESLRNQFHDREVKKTYLALVHGNLPHMEGEVNKPIGRSSKGRMAARVEKISEKDREAITKYKVIQRLRKFDLVEAYPLSGRTHQIRVHLMSLGNPVVGDSLYTIHGQKEVIDLGRLFLHATKLEFADLEGNKISVESKLPTKLKQYLKEL